MLISGESKTYSREWEIEHPIRKAIMLPLITRIMIANTIQDLDKMASCDQGLGVCFIFNEVGKLYFQCNTDSSVKLLKYIFANHQK